MRPVRTWGTASQSREHPGRIVRMLGDTCGFPSLLPYMGARGHCLPCVSHSGPDRRRLPGQCVRQTQTAWTVRQTDTFMVASTRGVHPLLLTASRRAPSSRSAATASH